MRLGVLAALRAEVSPALKALHANSRRLGNRLFHEAEPLVFLVGGVGPEKARRAARCLVEASHPAALISAGFVGAVVPDLSAGDLVLGGSSGFAPDEDLLRRARKVDPTARVAEVVTVDQVVVGEEAKSRIAKSSHAVAVDMESAAVAMVARECGLGFLCAKVVLDTISEPLASTYESVPRVLGEILRRPRTVAGIFRDAGRSKVCGRRLGEFFLRFARAFA